ncbi:deoxyribonuclease gamma [Esox lucius]|uniref:Deoxyribonuclease n=1 Tax=Esox lucius TaxID=8010 RepID=A0AAY5KDM9_ESOLU|nr:deoxyribonuclease gamma [Esox lucius]
MTRGASAMQLSQVVLGLVLVFSGSRVSALKICTFNIQSFGEKKMEKPEVVEVIVDLIVRCDIMLVMEIKDAGGKAFPQLMTQLNSHYISKKNEYSYVISDRLGRKSYKEQYAFVYRTKQVTVKEVYQYPDTQPGDQDAFSREPFVVWFSSPKTAVQDFVIIPIHTTPETSVKEIDELYDVFQDIKKRWSSENVIIMGDFNAACGYVPKKQWGSIRLRSDSSFLWLTGDTLDTTVKESTDCSYDRIVLHGDQMIQAVNPSSLDVFNFRQAYGLSELQALAVSDHFPVCITVKAAARKRTG